MERPGIGELVADRVWVLASLWRCATRKPAAQWIDGEDPIQREVVTERPNVVQGGRADVWWWWPLQRRGFLVGAGGDGAGSWLGGDGGDGAGSWLRGGGGVGFWWGRQHEFLVGDDSGSVGS